MTHHQTVAVIALSALAPLAGSVLSALTLRYDYQAKDIWWLRAEIMMMAVLFGVAITSIQTAIAAWQYPVVAAQIQMNSVIWRYLFFSVPLCFYISARKRARTKQHRYGS